MRDRFETEKCLAIGNGRMCGGKFEKGEERYEDAQEFLNDVKAILQGHTGSNQGKNLHKTPCGLCTSKLMKRMGHEPKVLVEMGFRVGSNEGENPAASNDILKYMGSAQDIGEIEKKAIAQEIVKARELLFHWQHRPGTNFGSLLFNMFMKADPSNMMKLKRGFPVEHSVWREWYDSQDPDKLFEQWGLK